MFADAQAERIRPSGLCGATQDQLVSGQGLAGGTSDLDLNEVSGRGEAIEVDDLVVGCAAPQAARIRARGTFDQHLERASDEPLSALVRAALDHLDQPLEPLHLDLMR